jgi:hypothetical protein
MEQEVEIEEKVTTKNSNRKKYDVFISYRRVPRVKNDNEINDVEDNDYHHSTSLARAIALEYTMQGLDVYFDCGLEEDKYLEALDNSKHIIVLLAEYSFNVGPGCGENYRKEVNAILELMKKKSLIKSMEELKKSHEKNNYEQMKSIVKAEFKSRRDLKKVKQKSIYWIDIDGRFDRLLRLNNNGGIYEANNRGNNTICKSGEEVEWSKAFQTIKQAYAKTIIKIRTINTSDNLTRYLPKIKKCLRVSFKTTKMLSLLFAVAFVALAIITPLYYEISQPGVIFVGGGTVEADLKAQGIDVNNYAPNSKYIHLPSGASISVLKDIVNEKTCHYYPIILSTGKLDYDPSWMGSFRKTRKILQVFLDSVPLMVQLQLPKDYDTIYENSISLNELKTLIARLDYSDHFHTTSPTSGTYNMYASILHIDDTFLRVKPTVFNQRYLPEAEDTIGIKVILANEMYYYGQFQPDVAKMFIRLRVRDSTGKVIKIPVYAYAATEELRNGNSTEVEISRPVLQFINKFNDTIKAKLPIIGLKNGIFLEINPNRK